MLSRLRMLLLPGLAFKAIVIGGGYATGREIAEFFGHLDPLAGLAGLVVSAILWSILCALVFMYAHYRTATDYRTFFKHLLGPFWPAFEILLILLLILVLAIICAAAGEIIANLFGLNVIVGELSISLAVALAVSSGSDFIERLFGYSSLLLYGAFFLLVILTMSSHGHDFLIALDRGRFELQPIAEAGLFFSGYNVVGAVLILSTIRHLKTRKEAAIAGLLCGPLAVLPGLLLLASLIAIPGSVQSSLPSDEILNALGMPIFRYTYQIIILVALLETGVGSLHSINERVATTLEAAGKKLSHNQRFIMALSVMMTTGIGAAYIGFVELISNGYRAISLGMMVVYMLPLLTLGSWQLYRSMNHPK